MNKAAKPSEKPARTPVKNKMIEMPEDIFTPEGVLITSPLNIGQKNHREDYRSKKAKTEHRN